MANKRYMKRHPFNDTHILTMECGHEMEIQGYQLAVFSSPREAIEWVYSLECETCKDNMKKFNKDYKKFIDDCGI